MPTGFEHIFGTAWRTALCLFSYCPTRNFWLLKSVSLFPMDVPNYALLKKFLSPGFWHIYAGHFRGSVAPQLPLYSRDLNPLEFECGCLFLRISCYIWSCSIKSRSTSNAGEWQCSPSLLHHIVWTMHLLLHCQLLGCGQCLCKILKWKQADFSVCLKLGPFPRGTH